jgi:hypothetical protein
MFHDPSRDAPRGVLRVRARPHVHPDHQDDVIVEVVREGEVVATIYGSREGVHIVSPCFGAEAARKSRAFLTGVSGGALPGMLVPLLREREPCPWCGGARTIAAGEGGSVECPICG